MGQKGSYQIRGYGAASEYYFGKPIGNLETSECALLAAIVNSPGLFNPFTHPEKAFERRKLVLNKMEEHQFITKLARLLIFILMEMPVSPTNPKDLIFAPF